MTLDTSVEDANLLLNGDGDVLLLVEELSKLLTSVKHVLGGGIQIGTELGESSDFSVLSEFELEGTRHLLHGLDLSGRTDTGHGKTDVNGGSLTLVEELGFKEDLTIGNGDNVSGDIGGHITSLGLNDGKSGQRTTTLRLVHLSCSFEETGMEIENITGVSLTTRRSSQKKGHLSVGNSLLGEIVIDNESVLAVVSEVLTDSATGVRSQVLKRSGLGGGSSNNDRVLEGIRVSEELDNVSNSGSLLTNSNVDRVELLVDLIVIESRLLVKDSINSNSGFTSLSVTNDELTLASTNRHKSINGLKTSLHRLVDGLSRHDTGSLKFDSLSLIRINGTLTIDGVTKSINNSTEKTFTERNIDDGTSSLDNITFLDFSIVTQDDDTNVVSLKVEGHTLDT
mmetsp:Transcript_108989/g.150728  ORF Transcript_108989/g.150728 Transcript_108989/m.150728 type:complete len:396 (-) Transcript_108989:302-1489(-)